MIELRKVDADNLWDIAALSVAPHQKGLVSPNTHSIMEAYVCITSGGPSDGCWLSYEPNNHAAHRLYQSFGFEETGEMDGCEVIALLKWRKDK